MTGKRSRRKGASYERELVHLFRDLMPGADVRRGLQSRDGAEVADVDCPVFWVEAKRGKRPLVRRALEQATEAAQGSGKIPLAVIRDDRKQAFVALHLSDFADFIKEWWERR
jgi:Holliday junction resolvase